MSKLKKFLNEIELMKAAMDSIKILLVNSQREIGRKLTSSEKIALEGTLSDLGNDYIKLLIDRGEEE